MSNVSLELQELLSSNLSELFFINIGSSWTIDAIYLFAIVPLAFIGLVFNLISCILLTLSKKLNNIGLYRYIIAYTLNNVFVCFVNLFSFCSLAPRFVHFFYSPASRLHRCFIVSYLIPTFIFVGRVIEILILCDRLANFNAKFKRIVTLVSVRTLVVFYVIGMVINLPAFFNRETKSDEQLWNDIAQFNVTHMISYCYKEPFMRSSIGNGLLIGAALLRDLGTLCVEISLSFSLTVSFRRFLAAKKSHFQSRSPLAHSDISPPKSAHHVSLEKLTLTITRFSLFSVSSNTAYMICFLITSFTYNNFVTIPVLLVIILILLIKPIVTILFFLKLDKNFKSAFFCSAK